MSQTNFVFNVEVSCEENLSEMYGGMTLQMALVKPSNELVVCKAHIPAVQGLSRHDAIVEGLSSYFGPKFRRANMAGIDYLAQLASDLQRYKHKDKDFARIALMLYNSQSMICKPSAFKEWYKVFCEVVGCRYVESYHPHNIGSYEKMRSVFYYVE